MIHHKHDGHVTFASASGIRAAALCAAAVLASIGTVAAAGTADAEVCLVTPNHSGASCVAPSALVSTHVTLSASQNPVLASTPPALTATVDYYSTDGENLGWHRMSSGTVTFSNAAAGWSSSVSLVNGIASVVPLSLAAGGDTITAHFDSEINPAHAKSHNDSSAEIVLSVTGTVSAPPTAVAAKPGTRQLAVSWNAPANNGGSAIDEYKATAVNALTGRVEGTCGAVPTATTLPAPGCTITGLTSGAIYYVTVNAQNATGLSLESVQIKGVPA